MMPTKVLIPIISSLIQNMRRKQIAFLNVYIIDLNNRSLTIENDCKTFDSQDSLVVTHPTTNWPLSRFS